MTRWMIGELADTVERGLRQRALEDDAAQSVYGFDALDELGLHPVLRGAFLAGGYGAWPEVRYPGQWHKRKRSEGQRCDLVLTPAPQGLPLRDPEVKATLFDAVPAVDAEAAYWLEVKTVAQFETGGPFRRYAAELLSPVTQDVKKIWSEGVIRHGGLLIVLFTADRETAELDLVAWHTRCMDRGFPVGPPAVRTFPITDRIGNAWCSAAVFGVRGV